MVKPRSKPASAGPRVEPVLTRSSMINERNIMINKSKIALALAAIATTVACAAPGPASAAPLGYDEGTSVRDLGEWPTTGPIYVDVTWVNHKWPTAAAVNRARAQTGLDIRVTRGTRYLPDFTPCQNVAWKKGQPQTNCVTASSDRRKGRPRVAVWSEGSKIVSADVTLKRKPGGSKASRTRALARVLVDAVGR